MCHIKKKLTRYHMLSKIIHWHCTERKKYESLITKPKGRFSEKIEMGHLTPDG